MDMIKREPDLPKQRTEPSDFPPRAPDSPFTSSGSGAVGSVEVDNAEEAGGWVEDALDAIEDGVVGRNHGEGVGEGYEVDRAVRVGW